MIKRILIGIFIVLVLIAGLGGIKGLQIKRMIAQGEAFQPPPETVTTAEVRSESWESALTAVGSLEAVQGVVITAEISGKIVRIGFESGTLVKRGQVLVQQDFSSEAAQLRAAEAVAARARLDLNRSVRLLPDNVIARADLDRAEAQYEEASAQADAIRATIAKKTIKAPFTGRLGLREVNMGQILNSGDPIVSLQAMDPIYVNFLLPQRFIAQLTLGLVVRIDTHDQDLSPKDSIVGKLTTINPQVDPATRNIRLQATLSNSEEHLRPGMYVNVSVVLPRKNNVLAIPATAVLNAAYGDSVFVVEKKSDVTNGKDTQPELIIRRQFVQLGKSRGDFVAVTSGLSQGQIVVSTGVFKLRNNQTVVVDNTLEPNFKYAPEPENA